MFPSAQPVSSSSAVPVTITMSGSPSVNMKSSESDIVYREPEKCYNESFSKSILRDKIEQYKSGKYTEKYIHAYLEFVHINSWISNLEYLEFKTIIKE